METLNPTTPMILTPQEIQTQEIFQKTLRKYWSKDSSQRGELWLKFMRDELHYTPDEPVEPIIRDFAAYKDTAVRSSHGVGKTTLSVNCLLTALALTPELLVLQLSPTWSQVKGIFWNELRKWHANSQILSAMFDIAEKAPIIKSKIDEHRWYAQGLASNMPGKIEGKHAKRVLLICDETKAIPDDMIEAIQGALTADLTWRLYVSTPSTPGGRFTAFYKCFTRNRAHWKTHKITASQSPRVSKKWIERMYSEYGKDSQIVLARVEAEFPDTAGDILIPLQYAEQFFKDDAVAHGAVAIGVDVARFGEDESVISVWKGETMIALRVVKVPNEKKKLTEISRETRAIVKEFNARAVVVDDIGVGGGVTDNLSDEEGAYYVGELCQVVPFVASAKSKQPHKYALIGDEVFFEFAEAVKQGRAVSQIDDEKLVYQLSSYKKKYTAKELIQVAWPDLKSERTSDEKSPDRGDAACLGWFGSRLLMAAGISEHGEETSEPEEENHARRMEFEGLNNKLF
jgi:phage terminase large subunit